MRDPIWLDVPFSDKDAAKAAGARWNPEQRRWFAPRPDMRELDPWLALPELLPGEDRTFGSGLFVDLIPASCWFTNVRSCVDTRDWDRLPHGLRPSGQQMRGLRDQQKPSRRNMDGSSRAVGV